MSGASREAFDLHNKACWYNFKSHLKYDKFKLWFWKLVISDTWNNVCPVYKVPNNLQEAMNILKTRDGIEKFKNEKEENVCLYHHTIGRWIRNNWGLWEEKDNQLKTYFKTLGIWHADDMSSIILTSLWRQLNNKPLNIDEQVKVYKDYWFSEGVRQI